MELHFQFDHRKSKNECFPCFIFLSDFSSFWQVNIFFPDLTGYMVFKYGGATYFLRAYLE
jgi:hypothetical protein